MNISNAVNAPDMPLNTHWTSHDLADAVPLQLSELLGFDADLNIGAAQASANTVARRHTRQQKDFVRNTALSLFYIR